jgi:hypothetical protein
MNYVTYIAQTGEIKTWGTGDILPQASDEQGLPLSGTGSPLTHYVKNGVLTAYTTPQVTTKAAQPSYLCTWSNSTFSWVDSRNLATAQNDTWNAIKAARDINLASGFTWGGSKFDSDDISQQRIQGAVQLAVLAAGAGQSFSIQWTLFDNSVRTLSGSDMISVGIALGTFVQTVFSAGVILRQQIDAATTLTTLGSISWANIS